MLKILTEMGKKKTEKRRYLRGSEREKETERRERRDREKRKQKIRQSQPVSWSSATTTTGASNPRLRVNILVSYRRSVGTFSSTFPAPLGRYVTLGFDVND